MDPKIREALDLIQESQNLMGDACKALCSVKGMGEAYGLTCKMHRTIKAHWHEVDECRMALLAPQIRREREAGRANALAKL